MTRLIGIISWSTACVLATVATSAGQAHALTVERGVSNNSETMWIGMVDMPGDGTSSRVAALCIDGPGASDIWIALGNHNGLGDDYEIHGDSADSGTGNDTIRVVGSDGTNPTGYCGTGSGGTAGGTWNRLAYNGRILDLFGDGGADSLHDGGGSNDTWTSGGAGNDYLPQVSSIGRANGGAGQDTVYGLSSGSGDRLLGGDDADCLWDSTNTFTTFDCGGHTNDTRSSTNSGAGITGCPQQDPCCGLC
jgi:hypothetical protein